MYSYEDRIRAVELYIRLGKRVRATILQLGYPTKNALKGWHREYEKRLDLPVGFAVRGPKYSDDESVGLPRSWNVDRMGSRGASSDQESHSWGGWPPKLSRFLEAGGRHRSLQSRRKCAGRCRQTRRVQADIV